MKKKVIVLFLVISMSFAVFTGCQAKDKPTANSRGSVPYENSAQSKKKNQETALNNKDHVNSTAEASEIVSTPTTEMVKELTAEEKFEKALLDMLENLKELGGSFGVNINDIFGLPKDVMSKYPVFDLSIQTDGKTEEGETFTSTIKQVSLMNGTDAAYKLSEDDGSTSSEGGVYFTADQMLIRKADLATPVIQYNLPHEGDGAMLADMLPVNRYAACLLSDDPAQNYVLNWHEKLKEISSFLQEKDREITEGDKELTSSSLNEQAKVYGLQLTGDEAKILFTAVIDALQSDFNTDILLRTADNIAMIDNDQPTNDTIADIKQAASMDLSLELCTIEEKAVAIFLNADSDQGTAQLEMITLGEGDQKADSFFTKFTHLPKEEFDNLTGGYTAQINNSRVNDILNSSQVICNPDGTEAIRIEGQSKNSETGDQLSSDYSLTIKSEDATTKVSGMFTQATTADQIDGQISGEVVTESTEDGVTTEDHSTFTGTLSANQTAQAIEMPMIVEGSAEIANNRDELGELLFPSDDTKDLENTEAADTEEESLLVSFADLPPTLQVMYAYFFLFL